MKFTENAFTILATQTYRGVGKAWAKTQLPESYLNRTTIGEKGIVKEVVEALTQRSKEPLSVESFKERRRHLYRQIKPLFPFMDGMIALGDPNFPQPRGKVKNSEYPICLFYKGDISLLANTNRNIAVIGLLQPEETIVTREKQLVKTLVSEGATIVSGLALGCDTVAHKTALELGGKTIAILPAPLNTIMPSQNKALAEEIVAKGGLLITEYYTPFQSRMELTARYAERDRLQALFSDGIILTASYAKNNQGLDSGSRLAMEYAKNYGIPRGVMYEEGSDSSHPQFALNRQLLSEGGVECFNHREIDIFKKLVKSNSISQKGKGNYLKQTDLF